MSDPPVVIGRVRWFNRVRGLGFIAVAFGAEGDFKMDVMFCRPALAGAGMREIEADGEVVVVLGWEPGLGIVARLVFPLSDGTGRVH